MPHRIEYCRNENFENLKKVKQYRYRPEVAQRVPGI
jgi:hypothetical protein